MKEIKAYIRPSMAEKVIYELEVAGVSGMTVIDVSTIGKWVDPDRSIVSIEYCEKYCSTVKIELVCDDRDVEKFIGVIEKNARTGKKGDGKIFVSEVIIAKSIRTSELGINAL